MTALMLTRVFIAGLAVNSQIARSASLSDLKPQEQTEVYKTLGKDWEKEFSDEGLSLEQGRAIILGMDVEEIAAGKHAKSLLVSGNERHFFCSPTGNCSVWLFARDHNHLRLVLAGLASGVEVQKHMTQGMHDLALRTHWSASESHYTIYSWTGSEYKAVDCFVNDPNGDQGNCPF